MLIEYLTLNIKPSAVTSEDRILAIRKKGTADRVVDWQVTHREDRVCVQHGTTHVYVEYAQPDRTEGTHEFTDQAETLTVSRPVLHCVVRAA